LTKNLAYADDVVLAAGRLGSNAKTAPLQHQGSGWERDAALAAAVTGRGDLGRIENKVVAEPA
jgi:hypothetical protein